MQSEIKIKVKVKVITKIVASRVRLSLLMLIFIVCALPTPVVSATEVIINDASAYHGDITFTNITIDHATNTGVIDLSLRYNPSEVIVTAVNERVSDFDVVIPNLEENFTGFVRIGAFQAENPGLNGSSVVIANLILKAVGDPGGTSSLNITVNEFKDATPQGNDINYTITNGTFTINSPEVTPTPAPSNGGGGPVPTTPTPTPTEKPPATKKIVKIISSIEAGKSESVTFEGLDIYKISIKVDKNASDVNVMVEEVAKLEEITDAPGIVYAYYNITATNLTDVNVTATIEFKVNKSWIADKNVDEAKIKLNRYGEEWKALSTSKINDDDSYVCFAAVSPGFSIFAISGTKKVEVAITPTLAPTITPPSAAPTPTPTPTSTPAPVPGTPPLFLILTVIAVIVIAGIIITVLRRK